MELLYESLRILREDYLFNGYIHIKAIPGADLNLIESTGKLADRMSVNIELPSSKSLRLLAPQKEKEAILKPMGFFVQKLLKKGRTEVIKESHQLLPLRGRALNL